MCLERGQVRDILLILGKRFIQLGDQPSHLRNELHQPLRDENHAMVYAFHAAQGNDSDDIIDNAVQGHVFLGDFLRDERNRGLGLEGHFKGYLAGCSPHQFYKMVVFHGGCGILVQISHQFGEYLGGRIEAE